MATDLREAKDRASLLGLKIKMVVSVDRSTGVFAQALIGAVPPQAIDEVAARVQWYAEQLPTLFDFIAAQASDPRDALAQRTALELLDRSAAAFEAARQDRNEDSIGGFLPSICGAYQLLFVTGAILLGQDLIEVHQLVRNLLGPSGVVITTDMLVESIRPRDLTGYQLSAIGAYQPLGVAAQAVTNAPVVAHTPPASDPTAPAAPPPEPVVPSAAAQPVPAPPAPDGNPGALDPTFGDHGRTTTANLGEAHAAALQPDGRIVAVGYTAENYGKISVARYNPDGSLDPSFGSGGAVITELGPSAQATAVALQTDGKIVVAGNAYPDGFAVIRMSPDGSLDPTFGQGGQVLTPIPDHEAPYARAVAVLADGRIVVAGRAGLDNQDSVLVRYLADGSPDASFGSGGNGIVLTDFDRGFDEIYALCVQADGALVAAGRTASEGAKLGDFGLARYLPDGALDEKFGSGGKVVTDFSQDRMFTDDCAYAAALLANGQIIVAGTSGDYSRDAALARYNPDGQLDTTFGEGGTGRVVHDFGTGYEKTGLGAQQFDEIFAIAAEPDGGCVIAGSTQPAAGGETTRDFLLARYDADGRLDSTFGDTGVVTTDFGGRDCVQALLWMPDRRIVAVGHTATGDRAAFALARYLNPHPAPVAPVRAPEEPAATPPAPAPDAPLEDSPPEDGPRSYLDATFNRQRAVLAQFGEEPSEARALCIQPDGRIVVVGSVGKAETTRNMAALRLLPDGTLDDTFGSGGYERVDIAGTDALGNAAALQSDGKIVVAGEALDPATNTFDFALIRLDSDGHVDTSFNGRGFVLTDFLGGTDDRAYAVAVQPDGKIVAAGYTTRPLDVAQKKSRSRRKSKKPEEPLLTEYFALARYDMDGSLDESFGTQGLVMTPFEGDLARAEAVAVQSTGEIVATGFARSSPEANASDFAVVRYAADGSLDTSFGVGGLKLIDLERTDDMARALALLEDGSMLLVGTASNKEASEVHFALVRLTADGKVDGAFGSGGITVDYSFNGAAYGIALEPGGAILSAGFGSVGDRDMFAVSRARPDGITDTSFGVDGVMLLDLGGVIDRASAIALDGEGRIVVAGTSRTINTTEFAVARLLPVPSEGA